MERALFVVGVNHRTAVVAVRERLAYADAEIAPALGRLREQLPAVAEAALLSTCNRVELIALAHGDPPAAAQIAAFLSADRGLDAERFAPMLYHFSGRDAVRHLFRVSASLDSMVVGEPQILGQLKAVYAEAVAAGATGPVLHRAFHRAFAVGKQVRKATLIGHGAVSVSSAAVSLAAKIFDSLQDKTVMLVGAGRVAELAARNLQRAGIKSLLITSRTFDHAAALAGELGGTAVPYDEFKSWLKLADIVIASLAVAKPVLGPSEVEAIVKERRYSPMFLIDLGVPRNFDERINALADVYLYDIDDLGAVAARSLEDRAREAEKAAELVELEADAFMRWLGGLELVPAIKQIRSSIEQLRDDELERNQGWLAALPVAERVRVEAMTRGLVNKLLHRVLSALRDESAGAANQLHAAELARRLLCRQADAEGIALADEVDDEEEF
ncbi:MAG: glutamyl-tRNA reductase [Candidatus Binataceae bacterium]